MAYRVFWNELKQRRVLEVVAAFELDPLTDHVWMIHEVVAQAINVSVIDQVNRLTKVLIVNSLVVRALKRRRVCVLYVTVQPGPAGETIFTRYGQLRITQCEVRPADDVVRRSRKPWMEFPDPLTGVKSATLAVFQ